MPKPTDADKEFFRSLVPDDRRVEVRPMFGNLGAFVNGKHAMTSIRLAEMRQEDLRASAARAREQRHRHEKRSHAVRTR